MAAMVVQSTGLLDLPRNSRTVRVVPVLYGMGSFSFRLE